MEIPALNCYQAGTPIDQLTYTYADGSGNYSNKLQSIGDASGSNTGLVNGTTTYLWDFNGNLQSNANTANTSQNKSFTYNLLNLPLTATSTSATSTFTYDAIGNKLRKSSVTGGVTTATDYINGIQYKNSTTAIDFIQTEEGRATPATSTTYDYSYYLGDNLGNTRVTFGTKTGAAVVYQTDDYYPFGYEISRGSITSPKNEYLYNKKELQEEFGEYDYGARFYDPVIGRWNVVDPMAEQDRRTTPYGYTFDDPIRHTDPDGMFGEDANEEGGEGCCGIVAQGPLIPAELEALKDIAVGGLVLAGVYGLHAIIDHAQNGSSPVMQRDENLQPVPVLQGASLKNRLPDVGTPNTTVTNKPGTTTKVYGPNGQVQKEHNKGHPETHTPPNEKTDHVHDHKPNPNPGNLTKTKRMPGRAPKPNELQKDKAKQQRRQEEEQQQQQQQQQQPSGN